MSDEPRIVLADSADAEAARLIHEHALMQSIIRKLMLKIERLEMALIQHCPQGLH
jgi:hypothetical protein